MSKTCYLAVWEFRVKPESVAEFERVYGPEGSWARLFRRSANYQGTELLRDQERAGRYLTMDRWTSHEALGKFKQEFAADYAALDKECEPLTESELRLGDFETTGQAP
jgi:quinol monooxygenase YgiN